jgi:feruloyl esterase
MSRRTVWQLIGAVLAAAGISSAWSADCASLKSLSLPDTHITGAEVVSGPAFTPPGAAKPLADLPAFCRVTAVIAPAIQMELWLPVADWNGKFQGTGNGGYSGAIVYNALAAGVRRHYATANTDMGHASTSPDPGSWALGHPELIVDQGYRAQHETAVKSKAIIHAFYGSSPQRSYFVGCSSGGWQGLTEAQRYPHEYDGIVAGAPASQVIHLHAGTIFVHLAATQIAPAKLRLITDAVLAKCDARDGLKDGQLTDPRHCDFAPEELACKAGQSPESCLAPAEVSALKDIYQGLRDSSGKPIYPGWPRGVEYALVQTAQPFVAALASSTFKDMVFDDPAWDFHRMDYTRDVRTADAKVGAVLNNDSPDLRAFRGAGGKLILWHGWDDPLISALHTLEYYQKVAAFFAAHGSGPATDAANLQSFARLFLAPGVNHCGGGPGPDTFDMLTALENWVEHGTAPESVVASHATKGVVDRTRLLCTYPHVAAYKGSGDINDAQNFECHAP